MTMKVSFATIPVKDQDKALEFYTDKLGFELLHDNSFGGYGGQRWIQLKVPNQDMHIVLFTPPGQEDRIGTFANVSFTSDDVMAIYKELSERGVEFVQPVRRSDWGGLEGIFKDPDGNMFVLAQPGEGQS